MPKAAKKTHYTTEEAVEFCIDSSGSVDSEYDTEDEEMFREGKDLVRIYTGCCM